ncbi:MAG: hypothetical protein ACR2LI_13035 [Propionibacteriaceae bacterium]
MTTPDLADVRDRPVRTARDLQIFWEALMGEGGFGRRSLWLSFLETDGLPVPHVVPIDDLPVRPDETAVNGLALMVRELVENGEVAAVVMLLSRPGPDTKTADDRAWARALAPLSVWPVHLATTDLVQVFAPDDLLE